MPGGGQQEYVFLSGKAGWMHLFTPSQFNKYKIDLCLDNESLGKALELKKRGIRNNIKNENGEYWITLSSPSQIETLYGTKPMEPPAVVNPDGSPWDSTIGIGRGSDVTCKVWIRKYTPKPTNRESIAARLYGVKVDNLIEFNPKTDFEDSKRRIKTEGLKEYKPKEWNS